MASEVKNNFSWQSRIYTFIKNVVCNLLHGQQVAFQFVPDKNFSVGSQ